jgi:hypothetical protein
VESDSSTLSPQRPVTSRVVLVGYVARRDRANELMRLSNGFGGIR